MSEERKNQLRAIHTVNLNGKYITVGEEFLATDAEAEELLGLGSVEEVIDAPDTLIEEQAAAVPRKEPEQKKQAPEKKSSEGETGAQAPEKKQPDEPKAPAEDDLKAIEGVNDALEKALKNGGIKTIEDLSKLSPKAIAEMLGIDKGVAKDISKAAKKLLK